MWKKRTQMVHLKRYFPSYYLAISERHTTLHEFLVHGQNPLFLSHMSDFTFTLELVIL